MNARGLVLVLLVLGAARNASADACRGLSIAVASNDHARIRSILAGGCDPNAVGRDGTTAAQWLGSRPRASDDEVLATAKLLESLHCDFKTGKRGAPGLLTNLATRRLPKTLAFLAPKTGAEDRDRALRAVARGKDLESLRVLLDAGADPLSGEGLRSALSDAATSGRAPFVALMLKRIQDKTSPKVLAAYKGALRLGHDATARAFADAGVAPPPVAAPVRPLCAPVEPTYDQARIMERLGLSAERRCKLIQNCGDLLLVDCDSAADGPAYYVDRLTSKILATCGGACMGGCVNCPPKEWTCSCVR